MPPIMPIALNSPTSTITSAGTPCKFGSQAGLAKTGLTGHKTNLSLTVDHQVQFVIELLQLFVSTYKDPIQCLIPVPPKGKSVTACRVAVNGALIYRPIIEPKQ